MTILPSGSSAIVVGATTPTETDESATSSKLAPWSGFFLIGGFWLGIPILIALSIAYAAGMVAFALATLPVEIGASHSALALLRGMGFTDAEETDEIERVLRAAALTYVVGLLQQLGLLFALVLIAEAARRVAT